jgi:alkylation response protein AidB-like acyl-CoA dehydrogenase
LAEMAVHAAEALAACELASMRADLVDVSCDAASMARIKVVTGAQYIAKEAVQLHGAMGVCEELPIAATFRQLLAFCHVDGLSGRHAVSRGRQFLTNRAHENSQTL